MRITLEVSGGFAHIPALSRPFTTDTTDLETDVGKQIETLVHEAGFFDLPSSIVRSGEGADYRTYTLSIEDSGRSHTVVLTDPIEDPSIERLIRVLSSLRRS